MFIDIHTHAVNVGDAKYCITSSELSLACNGYCSLGIHPWNITSDWKEKFKEMASVAADARVVAIGECGIDKIKGSANVELQIDVLRAHIQLSEGLKKPLILHCVKGVDEIVALHRTERASQPWIIHGYRGKSAQAQQLLREGFYISFGDFFNKEALLSVPANRLFVESDTGKKDIKDIYISIAEARGVALDVLIAQILSNAKMCNIISQ